MALYTLWRTMWRRACQKLFRRCNVILILEASMNSSCTPLSCVCSCGQNDDEKSFWSGKNNRQFFLFERNEHKFRCGQNITYIFVRKCLNYTYVLFRSCDFSVRTKIHQARLMKQNLRILTEIFKDWFHLVHIHACIIDNKTW